MNDLLGGRSETSPYWPPPPKDPNDPNTFGRCDPNDANSPRTGGFVSAQPDAMQDYTYMADHMGNITALVDSTTGEACRQVFDAFGVNIGGYISFRCAADHDYNDMPWHGYCGHWGCWPWKTDSQGNQTCAGFPRGWEEPDCPLPPERQPRPIERMQTGSFNWRGGEGSVTDRVTQDMQDSETHELRWSAYTRPSTGLIYMGARYYEPETGRFTQIDPMPYGAEMMWGQNNRWVYCANDPVNFSDPTGELFFLIVAIMILVGGGLVIAGTAIGGPVGTGLVIAGTAIGTLAALAGFLGPEMCMLLAYAIWCGTGAAIAELLFMLANMLLFLQDKTCSPSTRSIIMDAADFLITLAEKFVCAESRSYESESQQPLPCVPGLGPGGRFCAVRAPVLCVA